MRGSSLIVILTVVVVAVTFITGCGRGSKTSTSQSARTSQPTTSSAALGTEQTAGPFQVNLASEPAAPKVGKARFTAKVMNNGNPVKDAEVNLDLSMPSMEGPSVTLKPSADRYEGAADLSMAGDWTAKVTVTSGGETGSASYKVTVSQ